MRLVCPDADRPAETVASRLKWLLAHDPSVGEMTMEPVDYQGQPTAVVVSDIEEVLTTARVQLWLIEARGRSICRTAPDRLQRAKVTQAPRGESKD